MRDSPHPLAFTPVPARRVRHDGWTPWTQARFILSLGRIGCVKATAGAVGRSRKSAYALRARPGAESFAAAWDAALAAGQARNRDHAIERAINGTRHPVFYRGKLVGHRHKYDHRLMIAVLRHTDPLHAETRSFQR